MSLFKKKSLILFCWEVSPTSNFSLFHRSIWTSFQISWGQFKRDPLGFRSASLWQCRGKYFLTISWNIYCSSFALPRLLSSPGLFSLLEYQQVMKNSASESTMENAGRNSDVRQQSGTSIQVISLPERSPILPSIVYAHSDPSKESRLHRDSQMQKRRVTWAM